MLLAPDQLGDRKADDFALGFEVRPVLATDELESLQRSCLNNPRQDDRKAIDRLWCNLALNEAGTADGDQADIGRLPLVELNYGALDNRVWRRDTVLAA